MSNENRVWVIVRTELRHEAKVYRAILDMGHDAWLPQMPRMSRTHRTVKHRREWWKPTMPTLFFAKIDPMNMLHLQFIPFCRGLERRWSGEAIVLPEADVLRFRHGIEDENREIIRQGRRTHAEYEPRPARVKVSKPSRKIKRHAAKPPKQSHHLTEWTHRLIKAEKQAPASRKESEEITT